ncbi:MAG: tripartite tricarboxylate transporter substrate binding protein [Polaromonas sp.]|uniref:tripartite tricarboxylate transporter substrate binding protein n=1 Tax=Polaromonas sp. TaxID=1869339 RepID=UPI0025F13735|nr:tripartite tricarboxylate transporter substrate binding protein [Polaromonas sp.]MBI2727982.1 tripartite tricarboxylate transporter substrate binding protein [Polaromonas sp.]
MQRRAALLTVAALAAVAGHVRAQGPGGEGFRIVAPFPPGGPIDSLARILAAGLTERYKQSAVVENLAGAAGNIGIEKVRRARPDGQTLLVVPAGNLTINPTLMPNFPFNIERDFVPITMLAKAPNVLVANPSLGVKNAKELVAMAKARPGKLAYASPGIGSGLHLAGELFKQQADVDLLHVPYKGTGPALNDVLGGQVPLMFSNLPATLAHIRSGKLLALGTTESARSSSAPDIPTLAEQGINGVVVTSWYGLLAPAGTPAAVAERLAKDAADILGQPAVREQLKAQGLTETLMKPAEFATYMRVETAQWAKIIKARNIVAE